MTVIREAFCATGQKIDRRTTSFGLHFQDGTPIPGAEIRSSSWVTRPSAKGSVDGSAPRVFGPALFAGSVDKQFGFVLLNSLGRLHALDDLPPETTVFFGAKPQARAPSYGVVPLILRALGVQNPIVIAQGNLWFEELHLAADLFSEATGARAMPRFYDWIDRRWPADQPPDANLSLYVTRSGMGAEAGRYACEDFLESLLKEQGYQVFSPERHSITDQVTMFRRASRLIFAEGSAVHLFSLVRQPGQISAVIHRRPELPEVMIAQMSDRSGVAMQAVNAVTDVYWPPRRGDHLGRSVLDFNLLGEKLLALGLVEAKGWRSPSREMVETSLRAGLGSGETIMTRAERADWLRRMRENKGRQDV